MPKIKTIVAREIIDSRGNPTVEVDVRLDDGAWGPGRGPLGCGPPAHARRLSCATAKTAISAKASGKPSKMSTKKNRARTYRARRV